MEQHFDVLIVGAGLSGIGAGYHLQTACPDRSYAILERRESIGGTWDLFRYPGIRSDSDMYTLGYSFQPWPQPKAIADGPSILKYVRETAAEYGIDKKIRYGLRVKSASWSTPDSRWTVEAEHEESGTTRRFSCNFLFMCAGYYNYDKGYTPEFEGFDRFKGPIVHPQKWGPEVDYAGKRVVVVGSGATAVTIVPEIAKDAAHVTMLQRSPTYVVSAPARSGFADRLRSWFPDKVAYSIVRWRNILLGIALFSFCQRRPEAAKRLFLKGVEKQLGPDYDVQTHFNPRYNPWEQRMCLVPDADLFEAIKDDSASVVTAEIDCFTETGIKLRSGEELPADLIVTATGLDLQFLANLDFFVDGKSIDPTQSMTYKSMMFSDMPNLASSFGYTNASWTLKCDLTCEYVTRLLNHMKKKGYTRCVPRLTDPNMEVESMLNLTSGYIQRTAHRFAKQGTKAPWRLYQNYVLDSLSIGMGGIADPALEFSGERFQPEPAFGMTPNSGSSAVSQESDAVH